MKSQMLVCSALVLSFSLATPPVVGQSPVETALNTSTAPVATGSSGSTASFVIPAPRAGAVSARTYGPFSGLGVVSRVGFAGAGFDVATPLARRFNLRAGTDFFSYSASFQEQGANVGIDLHLRLGHAGLDWFPFGGRFRLSPQMVMGDNNRVVATAIIPSGSTITLNGHDYISSYSDPLHGSGRIDFRKVSPGFSLGFGNLIPRDRGHFSFPVEMGFYYVGQPSLQVSFAGSACDPSVPASVGCQSVGQDPGFQQNLASFKARNDHNLSYASFFPIFSVGFGYRLW